MIVLLVFCVDGRLGFSADAEHQQRRERNKEGGRGVAHGCRGSWAGGWGSSSTVPVLANGVACGRQEGAGDTFFCCP